MQNIALLCNFLQAPVMFPPLDSNGNWDSSANIVTRLHTGQPANQG
jgi:hypothetical protein